MANTTNFNWETPDDTDLVKDGAAAIRTLGQAIDTSLQDLEGGTTGQVLSKTSNTDMDFTWVTTDDANAIQNAIVDAKGDIIAASANDTPARLAVGTDNHRLVAASGETTGLKYVADTQNTVIDAEGDLLVGDAADALQRLAIGSNDQVLTVDTTVDGKIKWATPAGGASFAGVYLYNTGATQSINNNTATRITFNAERYDVGGYAASGSTITIPSGKAGYYFIQGQFYWNQNATGYRSAIIRKNTTDTIQQWTMYDPSANAYPFVNVSTTAYLAVSDTIELYGTQTSGGALQAWVYDNDGYLFLSYLGA
jgi:hypothetical protein